MKTVKKEVVNPSKLAELYNEALEIVENRHGFYGDFSKSLGTISSYWTTFLISRGLITKSLRPSDTATMLSLFKTARTANGFQDKDTFVDAANYFMQAYLNKDVVSTVDLLQNSLADFVEKEKKQSRSEKLVEKISKVLGRDITDEKDFQNFCKEIIDVLSTKQTKKEILVDDVGNLRTYSTNVE
jgi:hypothetical protein